MRRRLIIGLLGLLLAGLQYRLWGGDGGVFDSATKRSEVAALADQVALLRQRNAAREAEVSDLRSGGAAIEAHARKTLGMIRRGESFYLVVQAESR